MNHRPSGYEPDELPDCSTPRSQPFLLYHVFTELSREAQKNVRTDKYNHKRYLFSFIMQGGDLKNMSNYAAIYMRLSRDDGSAESESISSQRMLLTQYAKANGINVSAEFIDDGISGSQWNREGLQQLLQAVEDGWVSTVIVKDLSRLSRDYIRTGELLERWFPNHGVRLISVNDGVDTEKASNANDYSAIRAVMDDWYARDISIKVRAAIYARQKAGICTSASLPYGFCRSKGEICVDENAAQIIRKIYSLYLSGLSALKTAKELTSGHIPSPNGVGAAWSDSTVLRILKNPAYIGKLRLHKTERRSYKCSKRIMLPDSEAIYYSVPRIISDDVYLAAQRQLAGRSHNLYSSHWLSGKVKCGCCGAPMHTVRENGHVRLICGSRKRSDICRNTSLSAEKLLLNIALKLKRYGIVLPASVFPLLISHIVVDSECAHIYLHYRITDPLGSV